MATWTIDSAHTEIGFKIKHLVVSTVNGKFTTFEGKLEGDVEKLEEARVSFSADIASVHTGNEQRDAHLTSLDFFDAAQFPKLNFTSTSIKKKSDSEYTVKGDLTLKGVTKEVELDVEYGGIEKSLYGQTVAGLEVTAKIHRPDFGLTWSAVTEAGGLVVGNDVKLLANLELVKAEA